MTGVHISGHLIVPFGLFGPIGIMALVALAVDTGSYIALDIFPHLDGTISSD